MENEMMNYEEVMEPEYAPVCEAEESGSGNGIGTLAVVLATAGLTFVATKVVPKAVSGVKNCVRKWTTKKELHQPDEGTVVEVTEEDIAEVVE